MSKKKNKWRNALIAALAGGAGGYFAGPWVDKQFPQIREGLGSMFPGDNTGDKTGEKTGDTSKETAETKEPESPDQIGLNGTPYAEMEERIGGKPVTKRDDMDLNEWLKDTPGDPSQFPAEPDAPVAPKTPDFKLSPSQVIEGGGAASTEIPNRAAPVTDDLNVNPMPQPPPKVPAMAWDNLDRVNEDERLAAIAKQPVRRETPANLARPESDYPAPEVKMIQLAGGQLPERKGLVIPEKTSNNNPFDWKTYKAPTTAPMSFAHDSNPIKITKPNTTPTKAAPERRGNPFGWIDYSDQVKR
jgi:hypothetical protein